MKFVLKNGILLDVINNKVLYDINVFIDDNRISKISSIEDKLDTNSYKEIDIAGKYIIPGIVNMHQHFIYKRTYGSAFEQLKLPIPVLAIRALKNAIAELRMGITTVRTLGDMHDIDYCLKYLFENKYQIGPRMLISGRPLAITGSHIIPEFARWIDGVEEFRKWARYTAMRYDWVKVFANDEKGIPCKATGELAFPEANYEELKVVCEVAHNMGKRVATHTKGTLAIQNVIDAGVDTIEHGAYMTREQARQIKDKGIFYTPTITALTETLNPIYNRGEKWIYEHELFIPFARQALENAATEGVTIIMGLDSLGVLGQEAMYILEYTGFSPMEVLKICTYNGAKALGLEKEIGSVEEGKIADITILNSNPISEITNIEDVYMVVKDGEPMKVADINLKLDFETKEYNSMIPALFNYGDEYAVKTKNIGS